VQLPVGQSAGVSPRHKSLHIAVVDLGLNLDVPENLVLRPANLEFKFPVVNISNFVYIHPLDQRGYTTVKQFAVSFCLYS